MAQQAGHECSMAFSFLLQETSAEESAKDAEEAKAAAAGRVGKDL